MTLFSLQSFAGSSLEWHEGAIVLKGKKVCTGLMAVQPRYDVVLFKQKDRVEVYPAHDVISFNYYDVPENINRKFISLAHPDNGYLEYRFYEIVLKGDVSVLRRSKGFFNGGIREQDDFDLFTWYDHNLIPLNKFRSKLYPLLVKHEQSAVTSYVAENNLNPNKPADAILLLEFYNELVKMERRTLAVM